MKIWVDDVRPAPEGYVWGKSVEETKNVITSSLAKFRKSCENCKPDHSLHIELIDLDHDAGDCAIEGGDYINILRDVKDSDLKLRSALGEGLVRCNRTKYQYSNQYYLIYIVVIN